MAEIVEGNDRRQRLKATIVEDKREKYLLSLEINFRLKTEVHFSGLGSVVFRRLELSA
jgi:hypothetical protein